MGIPVFGRQQLRIPGGIAMSPRPKRGQEARQRLPGCPDGAGKATICREASTSLGKPAKRRRITLNFRPAKGGAPIDLQGRPASVMAIMIRRGSVSAIDVPRGWRLAWSISRLKAAGVSIDLEWFHYRDQHLGRYRLADEWIVEGRRARKR